MKTLTLPFPPSMNHYWRHWKGRTLLSADGRCYRRIVTGMCKGMLREPLKSRLAVLIKIAPPDNRRRDLDNTCKAILDALQHAGVYADDGQIDDLRVVRIEPVKGGAAIVRLTELRKTGGQASGK